MTNFVNRSFASLVRRFMPARRADWADAINAEAESLDSGQARQWLTAALVGALMQRFRDIPAATPGTLMAAIVVVLFFEWHTDEPLVVLPVLIGAAFVAGYVVPRAWLIVGIVLGVAILIAHMFTSHSGLFIPRYQKQAPSSGDYIAMALLVLPTLTSTWVGSRVSAALRQTA